MDRYSSEQIRSIAARALEIDPTQRQGFIVSACCDDPEAVRAVLEWIRLSQNAETASSTATVELGADYRRSAGKHGFSPGDIIDNRLKIIEYVNEGGMGEVYAALDLNLGETLALKAIRSDIAGLSGTIERFKTEVKQSLRITHPNVCRVHQIASHWDREGRLVWFLTMELLEGPTLAR